MMKRFCFPSCCFTLITALFLGVSLSSFAEVLPRPEYPRPQFERKDWVNLNGQWTYTLDLARIGDQRGYPDSHGFEGKITVPFCPESKLSGVEHTDFINTIWYQREITVPESWSGRNVLLHFGASDYITTVYVNGHFVDRHFGGGSSFAVDITRYAAPGTTVRLVVRADDNLRDGQQPAGKQSERLDSYGCMYTRTTGIWQTVWMEPVSRQGLKTVFAQPDIDQQQLLVRPEFYTEGDGATLTVQLLEGQKVIATAKGKSYNGCVLVLPVKNSKLWSPEHPFLYDLKYTVRDASGMIVDEISSYVGMRKVHVSGGYFYLNNEPYFQRLVLDQGFYPDGVWTAPSDEALRKDIELSKSVGFNGARLHQKIFEERYYYWADKLGYLCWGEQASWGMDVNSDLAARNFLGEWVEVLVRDRNHPCIVTWTPFNETWSCNDSGSYTRMMKDVYDLTKAIDPTRPVNDASGDGHVKTDIWSVHDYERDKDQLIRNHTFNDNNPHYRNQPDKHFLALYDGQPYMLDEFGGLPWIPAEHRANSWGYGSNIDTLDDFYNILEREVDAIIACPRITGFCYTQITDVEQEKNGIYFYDRRPKFDSARLRAIFEKIPSKIKVK